jgi:Fic family protein
MYIHELPGWPGLIWDPEQLAAPLAALRYRQGRLFGRMESLGFGVRAEAWLDTLTQDVIKSSEIEGEILERDQVRSSIARRLGIDIGALAPSDRNVEGVVEMMLDATQRYDSPLTEERLFGWHASLFPSGRSGMHKIIVGNWRDDQTGPMQVVSGPLHQQKVHFEAPAASRIPQEMASFLEWFAAPSEIDPVLKAGLAHLRFVTIHPFDDGNGRIARAIGDMALAQAEASPQRFYSMSAQIRTERNDYYLALERTQKGTLDVTGWLDWFLGCLDRAIEGADTTLEKVLIKARFWRTPEGEGFNDRQRKILNLLLDDFEGKLTSTKWARIAKCSQDTATRDINDLTARGILARDPGGGRSTSYSLVLPPER